MVKGNRFRRQVIFLFATIFCIVALLGNSIDVIGSSNSLDDISITPSDSDPSLSIPRGLEPRLPATKPKIIKVPEKGVYKDIVIVKLVEDSKVRLRGNSFVSLNLALPPDLNTSLSSLNNLILRPEVKKVKRLFTRPESELDEEKEKGERLSRKQLADLNLYYMIILHSGVDPKPILSMLNALDIVEIAYLEPIPEPAVLNKNKPSSQTNQMITPSATQTELITNGVFEPGSTGWVLSGNFYADSRFSYPHSSTGYAYLSNPDGTPGNNLLSFIMSFTNTPSALAPTVTTSPATLITTTSATLNGSVNPNGSSTTAWFEWGTSSTLSTYTQTPNQSIGSGTTSQAISASLSGLIPDTTYYYRVAASNTAGTQRGSILSFTTLSISPTPNFQSKQEYLFNTDTGVHALYAWNLPGGTGIGVKIVDIESGWQVLHEDFPTFTGIDGKNDCYNDPLCDRCNHGTAVIGEMGAKNNGIGVTGIAYGAQYSAVSSETYSKTSNDPKDCLNTSECILISDAINLASDDKKTSPGDIILIELHALGPSSETTCDSNCMICPPDNKSQFEYIPMEYWPANYDAIRAATTKGRIVVEAGGNGSMDLDSSIYGGRFDRSLYDSGAIIVGAGSSAGREPLCFTNYGSRIDVQGWGENVVTTGYGDLFDGDGIVVNDPYRYYTDSFNGTSSAAPIVAGSAASIQGIYKNVNGGSVLSPQRMRTLLRNTGTPQGTGGNWGYKRIGPFLI